MFRVKLLLIELLRLVHALLPAQYLQLLLPQSSLHLLHRRVPFPRPLVFLRAVRVQFGFEVGEVAMPLQVRDVEILQALLQAFVLVHVRRADGLERGQALLRALELGASFLDLSLEAVLVLVEIGQRSPRSPVSRTATICSCTCCSISWTSMLRLMARRRASRSSCSSPSASCISAPRRVISLAN